MLLKVILSVTFYFFNVTTKNLKLYLWLAALPYYILKLNIGILCAQESHS